MELMGILVVIAVLFAATLPHAIADAAETAATAITSTIISDETAKCDLSTLSPSPCIAHVVMTLMRTTSLASKVRNSKPCTVP